VNSGKDYKHLSRGSIPVYGTGGYMLSVDKELSNVDAIGIGRKGTIDHPQYLKAPFWTVDTLFFMTPKNDINIDFAFGLSQTINWKKYDESTGLPSLSKKSIDNISIKLPNYNEQIKIGRIISQIDNVISLQQRKLKELQQVKQTLSQFLLNGNTHTRPTLRFNGFEDIWKENKLKDIAKISMGQSPSSNNYNKKGNGKILIQGNADIDNGGIRPRVWTTEITKLANKNDILLTVRAPVGELAITNREVVIGRGIAAIKGNNFIYNLLVQKNKEHFWDRISSGSTFKSISSNDIKQLKVYIPSEKEETLIASILETIKNKIDFQNERINVINKLKKYLLTNLFI
jgi:type I restriction enzyme S subunit